MFDWFTPPQLEPWQWALGATAALVVGFAKTGISGMGTVAVPLMAAIFEAKASTGVLLPMLCMADIFAVKYYHRHADWKLLLKPLPWAVAGILIGVWVGARLDVPTYNLLLGIIVMSMVVLMFVRERFRDDKIPHNTAFAACIGLLGGFTTMVGNAAGPVWAIYLLSMQLPRYAFIGTGAWFFLMLNFFKVPFQIFSWGGITWETLCFDFALLPAIAVGAFLGLAVVKRVNERSFRIVVQVLTVAAAVKLLFF